jgi:hypothetical protein
VFGFARVIRHVMGRSTATQGPELTTAKTLAVNTAAPTAAPIRVERKFFTAPTELGSNYLPTLGRPMR